MIGLSVSADTTPLPYQSADMSVGAGSCASATCHGTTVPWQNTAIFHNEFTEWANQDAHAQAYKTLEGKAALQIAKKLNLSDAPSQSAVCLNCHSHNISPTTQGKQFNISEGVGCEACHGPAGRWLAPHRAPDATHAKNLTLGMYSNNNAIERATLCVSCHVGNERNQITHRIMAAGHPRLSFEITTFSALGQTHYQIANAPHSAKNTNADSIKLWAIGQALASQQLLETLADPKRGRNGLFPELTLYDCHSCHHVMSGLKATHASSIGKGKLQLNNSNLVMLRTIVRLVAPEQAGAFDDKVAALQQSAAGMSDGKSSVAQQARALSHSVQLQTALIEQYDFDEQSLAQLLTILTEQTTRYRDYADAEQAYMAIASLVTYAKDQAGWENSQPVHDQMIRLRSTLADEARYQPEIFAAQLAELRKLISTRSR